MSVDTDLAVALTERLTAIIDDAKEKLQTAMPFEQYQQACGMLVAWKQVRDTLIPQLAEEIQRK